MTCIFHNLADLRKMMGLFFIFFCCRKAKKSKENLFMKSEKSDLELDHLALGRFGNIF
jgi:hypothetical protein